jgi:acyl-CoA thioesterase FadM
MALNVFKNGLKRRAYREFFMLVRGGTEAADTFSEKLRMLLVATSVQVGFRRPALLRKAVRISVRKAVLDRTSVI